EILQAAEQLQGCPSELGRQVAQQTAGFHQLLDHVGDLQQVVVGFEVFRGGMVSDFVLGSYGKNGVREGWCQTWEGWCQTLFLVLTRGGMVSDFVLGSYAGRDGVRLCSWFAAHNAVGLAGESPVVGIDCLPT